MQNDDACDDCGADDGGDDDSGYDAIAAGAVFPIVETSPENLRIHSLPFDALVGCDGDDGDADELAPSPGWYFRCSQAYCQLWVILMWLTRCSGFLCFDLGYLFGVLDFHADF